MPGDPATDRDPDRRDLSPPHPDPGQTANPFPRYPEGREGADAPSPAPPRRPRPAPAPPGARCAAAAARRALTAEQGEQVMQGGAHARPRPTGKRTGDSGQAALLGTSHPDTNKIAKPLFQG